MRQCGGAASNAPRARTARQITTLIGGHDGGGLALVRSHRPVKAVSFAKRVKLAGAELGSGGEDFRRAILVAVVAQTLPRRTAEGIAVSKLVRLAAVDDVAERAVLAGQLARGELSDRRFRAIVARLAERDRPSRVGRGSRRR